MKINKRIMENMMKKKISIIAALAVALLCLFVFVGCGETDGYEGDYECYYYYYLGTTHDVSAMYEYYTLTLDGRGTCTAKFKLKTSPYTSATTTSKYEINGTDFIEKIGPITNTYSIENDVITLSATLEGSTLTVKFMRQY